MFGAVRKPAAQAWTKTLTLADFTETPDGLACQLNQWLQYRYRVPSQQMVRFGAGAIRGGVDDRGIAVIDIKDDSSPAVQIEGRYRLSYVDANEVRKRVVKEGYLNTIRASATVRDAGNVLAESGPGAVQDSWLVIEILPDAANAGAEISDDNSTFQIPVTIYTR